MDKTKIIIFSSKEGLELAQHVQKSFYPKEFSVKLWTNGFFEFSKPYIDNFISIEKGYDFAVFIVSSDDVVRYRNKKYFKPRDNVIFELGLCIGAFGLSQILVAKPDFVSLPTDMLGVSVYDYYIDEDINTTAGVIYAEMSSYINKKISKCKSVNKIDWIEYCREIDKLVTELKKPLYISGFEFDILVGINRGGLMTADLISREYGHHMPVLPLFADRRNKIGLFDSTDMLINNIDIVNILKSDKVRNILVVDSFSRRGKTIVNAKKYLENNLPDKCIKSALVFADKNLSLDGKVDYVADYRDLKNTTFSLV